MTTMSTAHKKSRPARTTTSTFAARAAGTSPPPAGPRPPAGPIRDHGRADQQSRRPVKLSRRLDEEIRALLRVEPSQQPDFQRPVVGRGGGRLRLHFAAV